MCTLTVIPFDDGGIRVACNRDESPLRPQATPPRIECFGNRQAILPRDPQAGGTWIGVNDVGLVFSLLNAYQPGAVEPREKISRGVIIPSLLESDNLDEALSRALNLDSQRFAPFRLVAMNTREVIELALQNGFLTARTRTSLDQPRMFTSSGLGDAVVDVPRRALFNELLADSHDWPAQQDAYHRHHWPEREEISVAMRRAEAWTVSRTVIEVSASEVLMRYFGAPPGVDVSPVELRIPRESH